VPVWVGRFCGQWIASDVDEFRVWMKISAHDRERRAALGID
jgi:hypothetical protein